jgi:filamentous hemagglutinin
MGNLRGVDRRQRSTPRSYDARNRLVVHDSASYAYNGDGVLVSDGTTTSAQDLAAPLSQVLSDGTDTYLYGQERLRALGGPWYVGDALGSVRQTLDDAGGVLGSVQYDPWGVPTAGTPQPFGFTGELHHQGQVYLRARWYAPGQGRFVSEDPFAGFPEMPYSLHAYQYGYSNPLRWTDPSGECPTCTPSPVPAPTPDPTVPPVTPTPTTPPVPPPGPVMGNGSHCIAGFFKQVAYNTTLGLADVAAPVSGESVAMTVCRQVGNAWSVVQGGAEFLGGGTLAVGGVVACGTGVLCIAGAPAALVGTGLATHGAGVAVMGTWQLVVPLGEVCAAASTGGGGGGSPTQSPQPNPGPAKPSIKGRLKNAQLPTEGRIRFVPPNGYSPTNPLLRGPNGGYIDKFGNEWVRGPSRTPGEPFEWDVQLSQTGKNQLGWLSRDETHINVSLHGEITHR